MPMSTCNYRICCALLVSSMIMGWNLVSHAEWLDIDTDKLHVATISGTAILLHVTPQFVQEMRTIMKDRPIGELKLAVFVFDDVTQTWNRARSLPCQQKGEPHGMPSQR